MDHLGTKGVLSIVYNKQIPILIGVMDPTTSTDDTIHPAQLPAMSPTTTSIRFITVNPTSRSPPTILTDRIENVILVAENYSMSDPKRLLVEHNGITWDGQ